MILNFFGHLISRALIRAQSFTEKRKHELRESVYVQENKFCEDKKIRISSEIDDTEESELSYVEKIVEETVEKKSFLVDSSKGAKISCIQYRYHTERFSTQLHHVKSQKIIIHCYGRNDCVERHVGELLKKAELYKDDNVTVVGMNFRNVMLSTGKPVCQQDWIDDVIAVVDKYVKQGIDLNDILLHGHSMGGAIVTIAAAQIYQRERLLSQKSVKIFNDRSFGTLPNIVVELIFRGFGSGLFIGIIVATITAIPAVAIYGLFGLALANLMLVGGILSGLFIPKVAKALCWVVANIVLWPSFGLLEATKAYNSLPQEAKDFIFVKKDNIILGKSGLVHALKAMKKAKSEGDCAALISERKLVASRSIDTVVPTASMGRRTVSIHDLPLFELSTKNNSAKSGSQLSHEITSRLLGLQVPDAPTI